jgi:hypothetical protein
MEFNSDQIAAIIGTKELEIISLRMEVARMRQKYEPQPANVQPIKEDASGNA